MRCCRFVIFPFFFCFEFLGQGVVCVTVCVCLCVRERGGEMSSDGGR